MQTHDNADADRLTNDAFMQHLKQRAEEMTKEKANTITVGTDEERSLAEWDANGVHVRRLPADEQGILRVSIGGSSSVTPVKDMYYCNFRGDLQEVVYLVRRALRALEERSRKLRNG